MKQTIKSKALVAGAITGGLAGASHAATVQITLTGNMISSSGGNQLVADITGDGIADVVFILGFNSVNGLSFRINNGFVGAEYSPASGSISNYEPARFLKDAAFNNGGIGNPYGDYALGNTSYLNPVTFTDSRINGNQATNGYLELSAFSGGPGNNSVTLTRFVFDNASTTRPTTGITAGGSNTEFVPVPEPSSLTLLALGAGGLLARRNRKKAA